MNRNRVYFGKVHATKAFHRLTCTGYQLLRPAVEREHTQVTHMKPLHENTMWLCQHPLIERESYVKFTQSASQPTAFCRGHVSVDVVAAVSNGGVPLQAGGAGQQVGRRCCLLVQTLPLPLWVRQLLAVSTNPTVAQCKQWAFKSNRLHCNSTNRVRIFPNGGMQGDYRHAKTETWTAVVIWCNLIRFDKSLLQKVSEKTCWSELISIRSRQVY